ncbi:MAG: hypothetical protein JWM34_4502 [Ilumatobacteraceae bacterium]|nr:hypothetical protein [Ilumatobacteraceae bacterium]
MTVELEGDAAVPDVVADVAGVGNAVATTENDQVTRARRRMHPKFKRIGASFAIALGIVLVVVGLNSSITGKAQQNLPKEIESITPVRSATQVQSQEKIEVDLADGYTGKLIVNGVELPTVGLDTLAAASPGKQVTLPPAVIFEPGNDTLTFTPTKGAPIEAYATGVNTVSVIYWKITDGPKYAKPTFTWQFDVV